MYREVNEASDDVYLKSLELQSMARLLCGANNGQIMEQCDHCSAPISAHINHW